MEKFAAARMNMPIIDIFLTPYLSNNYPDIGEIIPRTIAPENNISPD
ncbi:hypothetical protein [Niallia circulans]|nr:hypothetical protein [Niallia circulans]